MHIQYIWTKQEKFNKDQLSKIQLKIGHSTCAFKTTSWVFLGHLKSFLIDAFVSQVSKT